MPAAVSPHAIDSRAAIAQTAVSQWRSMPMKTAAATHAQNFALYAPQTIAPRVQSACRARYELHPSRLRCQSQARLIAIARRDFANRTIRQAKVEKARSVSFFKGYCFLFVALPIGCIAGSQ